jgi:hypothetical protein
MKRILSPVTNSAGLSAAALAVYAAAVMIYNAVHHHGVVDVPVIVAAIAAVSALYTRQKVTPVADPKDGNGQPMIPISAMAAIKPPIPPVPQP